TLSLHLIRACSTRVIRSVSSPKGFSTSTKTNNERMGAWIRHSAQSVEKVMHLIKRGPPLPELVACFVSLFDRVSFADILTLLGLAVKTRSFLMVDVRFGVNPHKAVPSSRSRCGVPRAPGFGGFRRRCIRRCRTG